MRSPEDIVDLVFGLHGTTIAVDYADLLWQALAVAQPWLADEAALGVHPLGRIGVGDGCLYLSRHSRLVLRLPHGRVEQAGQLAGSSIDLGGSVTLGAAKVRTLAAERVLYSFCVLVGTAGEDEFVGACRRELDDLGVADADLVVGKPTSLRVAGEVQQGYSLMVHGVRPEESLRLQRVGLGTERRRGCGLFVPHKSVAPVGA